MRALCRTAPRRPAVASGMDDAGHAWIGGVRLLEGPAGESMVLAVVADAATGGILPPGAGATRAEAIEEVCRWLEGMPPEEALGALELDSKDFAKAAGKSWPGMVRVVGPREDIESLLDHVVEEATGGPPPAPPELPSLREVEGVEDADLVAIHEAAALFAAAEVWERIPSGAVLEMVEPAGPEGFGCFTVMGAGGDQFGLSFFRDAGHARRAYGAKSPEDLKAACPDGFTGFHLDRLEAAAPADVQLAQSLGLDPIEVRGRPCVPGVYRVGFDTPPGRPPAGLVKALPKLLEVLAVIATQAQSGEGVTGFATELRRGDEVVRFQAHYLGS